MFGLFLGIAIYMLFFSKTIIKVSVRIIVAIKKVIYFIIKTILYPLKMILDLLKKIIRPFYYFFANSITNIKKMTKKISSKSKIRKN